MGRLGWMGTACVTAAIGLWQAAPARAATIATFVDGAFSTGNVAIYDSASVTVFLDPALTSWVAWNDTPTVLRVNAGCSAFVGGSGVCLGPGGFGTDDFIQLTVTNPLNVSLSFALDQNNAFGNSFGVQNVIFGTAANAPDAIRTLNPFTTPSIQIFNDAGPFNALFTVAGNYRFDFSFRNSACCTAGHQNIYLLAEVAAPAGEVPEPASLLLVGAGLAAVARRVRRRAR